MSDVSEVMQQQSDVWERDADRTNADIINAAATIFPGEANSKVA